MEDQEEPKEKICFHIRAYYFRENAPAYCPDCNNYVDGDKETEL
jgi:hypothetical protein